MLGLARRSKATSLCYFIKCPPLASQFDLAFEIVNFHLVHMLFLTGCRKKPISQPPRLNFKNLFSMVFARV